MPWYLCTIIGKAFSEALKQKKKLTSGFKVRIEAADSIEAQKIAARHNNRDQIVLSCEITTPPPSQPYPLEELSLEKYGDATKFIAEQVLPSFGFPTETIRWVGVYELCCPNLLFTFKDKNSTLSGVYNSDFIFPDESTFDQIRYELSSYGVEHDAFLTMHRTTDVNQYLSSVWLPEDQRQLPHGPVYYNEFKPYLRFINDRYLVFKIHT